MDSLDTSHGQEVRLVHQVAEAAGGRDEDVTTTTELLTHHTHGKSAVSDARAKHGAIAHAACFVENLDGELARWDDDDDQWLCFHGVLSRIVPIGSGVGARGLQFLGLAHELGDDGNEVGRRLAGTCYMSVRLREEKVR